MAINLHNDAPAKHEPKNNAGTSRKMGLNGNPIAVPRNSQPRLAFLPARSMKVLQIESVDLRRVLCYGTVQPQFSTITTFKDIPPKNLIPVEARVCALVPVSHQLVSQPGDPLG